jgi:hypothetical protein
MAEVKGMGVALQQAEAGMKLFEADATGPVELDTAGAEQYKAEVDAKIAALEAEAAKLTGKDNKKERAAKGKEVADLKGESRYIDACKVVKGLEPKHGNFVTGGLPAKKEKPAAQSMPEEATAPAPAADKKKEAKKKKDAGLNPSEEKELEKLKQDIIDRKAQLKAEGLSGGQQNKDEQIVQWVTRMNELKEKQDPGSTAKKNEKEAAKKKSSKAPLSPEEQKELAKLEQELEQYKQRLKTEFSYSKKEIAADPDLVEMEAKVKELQKRAG